MRLTHIARLWILLLPLVAACSEPNISQVEATVAVLAAQNDALATQNAALATQVAATPPAPPTTPTVTATAVPTNATILATTAPATATGVSTAAAPLPPTPTRLPATQPPPPPLPTATPAPALVDWYLRDVTNLPNGGKKVTFVWNVANVPPQLEVRIFATTQQRFQPWWVVAPAGEMTVTLARTIYPNPWVTLILHDPATFGDVASWSLSIPWACAHAYFFSAPEMNLPCPAAPPQQATAAEQFFENGRMLWIEPLDTIFIFYSDGQYPQWQSFTDLWEPGDPETDPTIQPPPNQYQPVRGFNKVWVEQTGVRARLGWGVAPEEVRQITYQTPESEAAVGAASLYVEMIDGQVRQLFSFDMGGGSWEVIRP